SLSIVCATCRRRLRFTGFGASGCRELNSGRGTEVDGGCRMEAGTESKAAASRAQSKTSRRFAEVKYARRFLVVVSASYARRRARSDAPYPGNRRGFRLPVPTVFRKSGGGSVTLFLP